MPPPLNELPSMELRWKGGGAEGGGGGGGY